MTMTVDPLASLIGDTYSILQGLLPSAETVAVADFPVHKNFGDSLIYLGQRQYLRKLGYRTSYLGDIHRYSAEFLRRRHPSGPIILHGGGSLGDRYPVPEGFREQVIMDFPDRAIVQMPQSMDFTDPQATERTRRVFGEHPNLLLLLRDQVSLAKARQAFPETRSEFCPDLAFGAGWLNSTVPITRDLTKLLRTDGEQGRRYDLDFDELSDLSVDWSYGRGGELVWAALGVPRAVVRRFPGTQPLGQKAVELTFDASAQLNVHRGRALLGPGRLVLSNRLHGVVLAALMKKPVVALDNSYGKIAPIYREYLGQLPNVRFAENGEQAREFVRRLHADARDAEPVGLAG